MARYAARSEVGATRSSNAAKPLRFPGCRGGVVPGRLRGFPQEWQARLEMLQLLPLARRYLEPTPPEVYEPHVTELRQQVAGLASLEGIAYCLRNDDPATRVLGCVALQCWEDTLASFELGPCFALERRDARRWRETRPLWQLLGCADRLDASRHSNTLTEQLDEVRTFLYANDDLDPGRECRTYLEQILFRNVQQSRALTPADLSLESTSWRAPRHDAAHQRKVYRFDVVVAGADTILNRIHRVEYQLPPAWDDHGRNRAHQVVVNRRSRFKLKDLAYTDLTVDANIHVWGQPDPIRLSTSVRITETGRRL